MMTAPPTPTASLAPAAIFAFRPPTQQQQQQQQQRWTQRRPFGVAPEGGRALRRASLQRRGAAEQQQQQEAALEAAGPTRSLQQLKDELAAAVKQEDYAAAAELRDALRAAEHADPLLRLRRELERAVQGEEYEEAARLRDCLKELQAQAPQSAEQLYPTNSDTITQGVRVRVSSYFAHDQSNPERRLWLFGYQVTITNEGDSTVMLRTRRWEITNAEGDVHEVAGDGVIGEKPILNPGGKFVYTSACPLKTPTGSMQGHYGMVKMQEDGSWSEPFNAVIGRFTLDEDVLG